MIGIYLVIHELTIKTQPNCANAATGLVFSDFSQNGVISFHSTKPAQ